MCRIIFGMFSALARCESAFTSPTTDWFSHHRIISFTAVDLFTENLPLTPCMFMIWQLASVVLIVSEHLTYRLKILMGQ